MLLREPVAVSDSGVFSVDHCRHRCDGDVQLAALGAIQHVGAKLRSVVRIVTNRHGSGALGVLGELCERVRIHQIRQDTNGFRAARQCVQDFHADGECLALRLNGDVEHVSESSL